MILTDGKQMDGLMKILIVEDNQPMRRIIRRIVGDFADEIYECGDGGQAFDLYAAQNPDWVLMDVEMAGVDGITATRLIRNCYPKAKILIITNYDETDLRQAARDAGAVGFVPKDDLIALQAFLRAGASLTKL